MQDSYYIAVTGVFCHFLLGLAVFLTNPRRALNRSFLLLTLVVGVWVSGIELVFFARDVDRAAFWLRLCSTFGVMTPVAFVLLLNSMVYPEERWGSHFRHTRWWLFAGVCASAFCLSPYYLLRVDFVPDQVHSMVLLTKPVFQPTIVIFNTYSVLMMAAVSTAMLRHLLGSKVTGVHRVELQFAWLGGMSIAVNTVLTLSLAHFAHSTHLTRHLAAARVIVFDIIIAYGITSRGILQIRVVLRLGLSYLLLAIYSGLIFTGAIFVLRWFFTRIGAETDTWPTVLAGMLAAVLVNTGATPLRRVARRILPPNDLDMEKIVSRVAHLLQSVATLSELLEEFSAVIGASVGAREVQILLPGVQGFTAHRAHTRRNLAAIEPGKESNYLCLDEDDPVVTCLREGMPDIAMEELVRHASTPKQRALLGRLRSLQADLIVPAHYRGRLSAIVLFSQRNGGRIYGGDGRSTLRLISEQLGVAIVNAHLYTEAQRSQAYNRLLVEHLPCGVITMDQDGTINVINPESRRLLQVDESTEANDIELPQELAELVLTMSRSGHDPVGEEIVLRPSARDQAHLRAYCLPFRGEEDEHLGTVLVLNDHTTLERLQRQVRQADRLASIGTLASGMAHEIKNPLTALKTFTQLLPKRYDDAEFRNDFSGLAGSEIARIERIVNQLLAFARPAPLMIEQVNLHEVIENAVKLVTPQAAKQNVAIRKTFHAGQDFIAADKDRLQQVLLNLILNALQASSANGWIELSTELEPVTEDEDPLIRLDVRDAGSGISQEMISHIFDPFFTTKSEGTGLGLSVSYNIVAEHKGRLEVQSESGKGTCFSVYLPVH